MLDKIAVLIPCYNESTSIAKVITDMKRELPEATIYVYDNNSTDGTDEIARKEGEKKAEYKVRVADIKHPVISKIFDELAPKYAKRAEEKGQGGGYTRIIKMGPRRGDAAETVILELVD